MRHTFSKTERLSSKKNIQELFAKGTGFTVFPFKVICLPLSRQQAIESVLREKASSEAVFREPPRAQVLFSCSKRSFKRAVDRNLIKRRMREAYRLHKHLLPQSAYFLVAYIYIGREILPYPILEEKLKASFKRLESISQKDTSL